MGLHKPEIIVLEFLRYFFFWLWPFPLRVNPPFQRFFLAEPTFRNWAPSLFSAAWCFVFSQIALLTAVFLQFKNSEQIIDSLVLVLLWYSMSTIDITMVILLLDCKLALNVINSALEMEERLCEEYPAMKAINLEGNLTTFIKFSLGPILAICVLIAPLAFVFIDKDPFYFILEEILVDPKYREFWTIIGAVVIRIVIMFSASVEAFRSGAYLYTIAIIAFDRGSMIIRGPILFFKNASKIVKFHIESRLLFTLIDSLLKSLLYILFTFFFWTTVMVIWVCVRCSPEQIGYLLYTWYVIGLVNMLVGGSYIGSLACHMIDLEETSVKLNVLMTKNEYARSHSWKCKITLKRAKAIRPIQLKYGSFGNIGEGFVIDYGCVLFDRVIDTLLMFE